MQGVLLGGKLGLFCWCLTLNYVAVGYLFGVGYQLTSKKSVIVTIYFKNNQLNLSHLNTARYR